MMEPQIHRVPEKFPVFEGLLGWPSVIRDSEKNSQDPKGVRGLIKSRSLSLKPQTEPTGGGGGYQTPHPPVRPLLMGFEFLRQAQSCQRQTKLYSRAHTWPPQAYVFTAAHPKKIQHSAIRSAPRNSHRQEKMFWPGNMETSAL